MSTKLQHHREIYMKLPGVITVPEDLKHQQVEVVFLPLESESEEDSNEGEAERIAAEREEMREFIERTAGKWEGGPLVREQPEEYDVREDLD